MPLTVNGSAVNTTTAAGTMYGRQPLGQLRAHSAGSAVPVT